MRSVFSRAVRKWGKSSQIFMLFEEMSELQKEICKDVRGRDNSQEILGELADVQIMLEQMKTIYNDGSFADIYVDKLNRLKFKLVKEKEGFCSFYDGGIKCLYSEAKDGHCNGTNTKCQTFDFW